MKPLLSSIVVLTLACTTPLKAEETICNGNLSGQHDNVTVPDGSTCSIANARIEGNLKVKTASAVMLTGPIYIGGNLQSEESRSIILSGQGITVEGSIQIKKAYEAVRIERGTTVLGNFQYEENSAPLSLTFTSILGDLQLFKNIGGARLQNNNIRQNMQCKENFPKPTGSGNRAEQKEDQCSAL
jgi:hypothetical protein